MNSRNRQIINKIITEIEVIESLIVGFEESVFLTDERTKRAVCMTLINIGELVKNLTEDFKLTHRHIPWKSIAGLRDITAHKYQTLHMGDVWYTIQQDIPKLKEALLILMDNC
jgi:uncharacterized protein with HEPN domain